MGDDDLVRVLVALSLSAVAVTAVFVGLVAAGLDGGDAGDVDTMPLALIFSTVALGVLGFSMAALQNERRSRLFLAVAAVLAVVLVVLFYSPH